MLSLSTLKNNKAEEFLQFGMFYQRQDNRISKPIDFMALRICLISQSPHTADCYLQLYKQYCPHFIFSKKLREALLHKEKELREGMCPKAPLSHIYVYSKDQSGKAHYCDIAKKETFVT